MYLHVGTHVDAPFHFIRAGDTIERLPLDRLVGDAIVLDLRHKQGKTAIERSDLETALEKLRRNGIEHKRGDRVILCTGHHERTWGTLDYWSQSPFLSSEDAAQWILDHGFSAVGYDFSEDIPKEQWKPGEIGPIHTKLLGNSIYNIEYLTGLDRIVGRKVWLSAAPILIKGVDGRPRVFTPSWTNNRGNEEEGLLL